jgi:predicted Zn finger-like uncharacterized protein
MRFKCDQCSAQYMITDEKVGKKGVKVRCKKCGFVIIIRPAIEKQAPPEPQQEKPNTDDGEEVTVIAQLKKKETQPSVNSDVEGSFLGSELEQDKELGQAIGSLLNDEEDQEDQQDSPDLDRQSTRLFSIEEMRRVQAERVQASLEAIDRREISNIDQSNPVALGSELDTSQSTNKTSWLAETEPERLEWYVAIDEQQIGPISIGELSKRRERGELGPETLVWKAGLDDWMPVMEISELRSLVIAREGHFSQETQPEAGSSDQQEPIQIGWVADETKSSDGEESTSSEVEYDQGRVEVSATGNEFVGLELDWKPTAVFTLTSLVEEELAALRPVDPQPEYESSTTGDTPTQSDQGEQLAGKEDSGSSIMSQIKAEDAAALQLAEKKGQDEKRLEEVQAAHLDRKANEEDVRALKPAARLGQGSDRFALPLEPYPSHRTSIPSWVVALLATSGLMIVLLLGFIAYRMIENPDAKSITPPAAQTTQPAAHVQNPVASDAEKPAERPSQVAESASAANPSNPPAGGQPNLNPVAAGSRGSGKAAQAASNLNPAEKTIVIEKARNPQPPVRAAKSVEDAPRVAEKMKAHEEAITAPTEPRQASARSRRVPNRW